MRPLHWHWPETCLSFQQTLTRWEDQGRQIKCCHRIHIHILEFCIKFSLKYLGIFLYLTTSADFHTYYLISWFIDKRCLKLLPIKMKMGFQTSATVEPKSEWLVNIRRSPRGNSNLLMVKPVTALYPIEPMTTIDSERSKPLTRASAGLGKIANFHLLLSYSWLWITCPEHMLK